MKGTGPLLWFDRLVALPLGSSCFWNLTVEADRKYPICYFSVWMFNSKIIYCSGFGQILYCHEKNSLGHY